MIAFAQKTDGKSILGKVVCERDEYKNFHIYSTKINLADLPRIVKEAEEKYQGFCVIFHQAQADGRWNKSLTNLGFKPYAALPSRKEILFVFRNGRDLPDFIRTGHAAFNIVYCRSTNRFLIVREKAWDFWTIPGGSINSGELPVNGAVRELWEEAGIKCEVAQLKLVLLLARVLDRKNLGVQMNDLDQIFFTAVDSESGIPDFRETTEVAWVTWAELGHDKGYKGIKFSPLLALYKKAMHQPKGSYITDGEGFDSTGKPIRQIAIVNTLEEYIRGAHGTGKEKYKSS